PYRLVHELPPAAGAAAPVPPPEVLAPFRVWVNQEQPRQRRAPGWVPFSLETGTALELEPGAAHRCLLDGAEVFAKYEDPTTLDRWRVTRTLRCSSDGFRTIVAGTVRAWYSPEGKLLDADPRAALSLVEPGQTPPRITAVVLDLQRPRRTP
ncbi:MAG: hypothetical protein FJ104_05260, partial [Deltaproteobacteria bacterium]|nr:hypothetical protein [Deltaproteobacteria bacterium]